jgi:acyl-CoA thioesterase
MTTFADLMRAVENVGDAIAVDLPEDWAQGRTAFGGLTAALCVEAAHRAHADLPMLRSAQFVFAGPASGRLVARPTVVRAGKSATIISVTLDGEAGPATRALLSFGAARESQVAHTRIAAPDAPDRGTCTRYFIEGREPKFARHFDVRLAAGSRPVEPHFLLWARHGDASGTHPETAFIALADAPPPAAFATFPKIAPISTLTWSLELLSRTAPDAWVKIATESEVAADGYSAQTSSFWSEDGRPIAVARQTVALFL